MAGPLTVTVTGPAAGWADLAPLREAGVTVVEDRRPVVVVAVDGTLPPATADLELIRAVSAATGRCAVLMAGLAPDAPAPDGWRAAVPAGIPTGPAGGALADELTLLADAPPNPVDPSPGRLRREGLRRALDAERTGRRERQRTAERRFRASVPAVIAEALDSVAPDAVALRRLRDAVDLDAAARQAALRVGDELGVSPPACPPAPDPPRPAVAADLALGALTLGAGVGLARVTASGLQVLGLPAALAWALAVVLGLVPAVTVVAVRIRARGDAGRSGWAAAHLARLRRCWEGDLACVDPPAPPDGWRVRHLAIALDGERSRTRPTAAAPRRIHGNGKRKDGY